ncbi:TPA: hypothetical protein HA219_04260 [Candidatus Woesearchaeota archaeon]|nr:hypothetical protein [uncultured archaeon]AQS32072.1 hypothetical protein [uncultured archaeon]MBS3115266.1 nucleotidyltransferase domain-containing protein [Candidatus Woesearchaeota archaeon]HIH39904.1 hypothetical protein [Candidatus Woesearchaeota archaeon]
MDLKKVISKIKPKESSIKKEIDETVKIINSELKKNKIKAAASVGGSFAKDTHLADDHDCDIFVRFDFKYKDTNLSDLLQKCLRKFKPERVHGSRDYFLFSNNLNFEVVPVLNISKPDRAVNVTDVSPLHVAWTKKHKKSDEIRLAKTFCKANSIYGAESYIKGFSGHVLDILTIKYGSFVNLLKASQKWKDKTVIDVEKHYKNAEDAMFKINVSKTQSPLVVVDPIQPERNAAAALGYDAFNLFVKKAKEFLKKPSEKFFERKILSKNNFKDAIIVDVVPLKGKRDVVGAKIMKAHEAIGRELEKNGFEIKQSGFIWDKETFIWFKMKNKKISFETIVKGPPLAMKEFVASFKKKHKSTFEKNRRIFAKVKREYVDAKDLIRDVIKKDEVKEKVRSIHL